MQTTYAGPLTEAARQLRDFVAARVEQTERERKVPDETIAKLKEAGIFRAFQSEQYGGLESHPADVVGAIVEIGQVCPSTAWIMGIVGIHQFELANMSPKLQDEVLGADQDTLISSSYSPQGTATPTDGGHVLNGRWKSSSGVDHASWVALGAHVPASDAGPGGVQTCYVPKANLGVIDDWHVLGLSGTGSKSVTADGVFVPSHRTQLRGGFLGRDPDSKPVNDAPLYRIPQVLMFRLPAAAPAIGAARGALAICVDQLKKRGPRFDGSSATADPFVQQRIGRAQWLIDTAELRMMRSIDEMTQVVTDGDDIGPEQTARYTMDFSQPGSLCAEAMRILFATRGASALYDSNPLQRYVRDIFTMGQHATQDPVRGELMVGHYLLGVDTL